MDETLHGSSETGESPSGKQVVTDIPLEESDEDSEFTIWETPEDAEKEVQRQLKERYWWLREQYQDLEVTEQFTFQDDEHPVEIFNFSEQLSDEHRKEIERALNDLRSTNLSLSFLGYILIRPDDRENPLDSAERLRGLADMYGRSLALYPAAMGISDYRRGQIEGVTELRGTIIHEVGHHYLRHKLSDDATTEDKWNNDFGRFDSETGIILPTDLSRCVTKYGQHRANEDFAESVVSYLAKPELLRSKAPDKFTFIEKNIGRKEISPVSLIRRERVTYPRIDGIIKYQRREPGEITIEPK